MCGIVGIAASQDAAREAFIGLVTLQHRGQDAAGIAALDARESEMDRFHIKKSKGLVEQVFTRDDIASLGGQFALGHTRYATTGTGTDNEIQPLLTSQPYGIALVHNGNLVNHAELAERLVREHRTRCLTSSDSETLLHWFSNHLEGTEPAHVFKAAQAVQRDAVGSYSCVALIGGAGLVAFRDPNGLRPLVLGRKANAYMVASESSPLSFLGYEIVRDLAPGEILFIDRAGREHALRPAVTKANPCMFEWVYFAGAESEIEGAGVYGARLELGRELAERVCARIAGIEGEIVVTPVPDTARPAATGLAEAAGLPLREILIKNRYITRTFIVASPDRRKSAVGMKLHPVRSEIEGRTVVLVDDSIVRGTTSRKLVEHVRAAGASRVIFVSTCPPVRHPCFYGIDFPDERELLAGGHQGMTQELLERIVANEIGADAVVYQTIEGLHAALARASAGLVQTPCAACLTGEYPTVTNHARAFTETRAVERGEARV